MAHGPALEMAHFLGRHIVSVGSGPGSLSVSALGAGCFGAARRRAPGLEKRAKALAKTDQRAPEIRGPLQVPGVLMV
jgi:hypothetical protein